MGILELLFVDILVPINDVANIFNALSWNELNNFHSLSVKKTSK